MSGKVRDESGQYSAKVTEQDLLKVFDYQCSAAEPMLKSSEVVAGLEEHFNISVSGETVRRRLTSMEADGLVASKTFGARATGWTALVGPRLSEEVRDSLDDARTEETTTLEDVADDVGVELD